MRRKAPFGIEKSTALVPTFMETGMELSSVISTFVRRRCQINTPNKSESRLNIEAAVRRLDRTWRHAVRRFRHRRSPNGPVRAAQPAAHGTGPLEQIPQKVSRKGFS